MLQKFYQKFSSVKVDELSVISAFDWIDFSTRDTDVSEDAKLDMAYEYVLSRGMNH